MPAINWSNPITSGLKFCFDGTAVEQIGSQSIASQLDAEAQLVTAGDGKPELLLSGSQAAGQVSYPLGTYETGIAGIGKLTLDVLVRFDDLATDWAVFGKWGAATDRWNYQISNIANGIRWGVGKPSLSGSAHIVTTNDQTTLLTAGQTHHIVVTYTNGVGVGEPGRTELRVYVDCEEQPRTVVQNVTVSALETDSWNRLMLGNNEYGTQPLPGGIKLARIWARKLTMTEIATLCADPYGMFSQPKRQEAGKPARDTKPDRRRIIIGDRSYWVTVQELPGLLEALLKKPPKPSRKAERAKAKPRQGKKMSIVVNTPPELPTTTIRQRYEAMLAEFTARKDQAAIQALHEAHMKADSEDEQEIENLLLRDL